MNVVRLSHDGAGRENLKTELSGDDIAIVIGGRMDWTLASSSQPINAFACLI
jgi:hypothetical protein